MTQKHTQRQKEQEEKGSSTRPLLLGPLGARGGASPTDEGDPTFPPAARQPGRRPHGQRQTDRLTDALKQERIAFLYEKKAGHKTNRQRQEEKK